MKPVLIQGAIINKDDLTDRIAAFGNGRMGSLRGRIAAISNVLFLPQLVGGEQSIGGQEVIL